MSHHSVDRRMFLEKLGIGSIGAMMAGELAAQAGAAEQPKAEWKWQPVSDRKVRFGIVGNGVCSMGSALGLQDHPNVEVVAVSDLVPERCKALAKACRCKKTYESLEVLVKDPKIEAVFVATDAPSHARHCMDALNHGKHVMTCVPATYGSVEEAQRLVETVEKTGL